MPIESKCLDDQVIAAIEHFSDNKKGKGILRYLLGVLENFEKENYDLKTVSLQLKVWLRKTQSSNGYRAKIIQNQIHSLPWG